MKDWHFDNLSKKGKDELKIKIQQFTPICKECCQFIHSEMFKKYLALKDEENRENENKKDNNNNGNVVNRLYNKVRQMKFI